MSGNLLCCRLDSLRGVYRLHRITESPSRGLRLPCPCGLTLAHYKGVAQRGQLPKCISYLISRQTTRSLGVILMVTGSAFGAVRVPQDLGSNQREDLLPLCWRFIRRLPELSNIGVRLAPWEWGPLIPISVQISSLSFAQPAPLSD